MPESLVHESPLEFFRGLVERAVVHQGVHSSEDTTFYVVNLLAGFVRVDDDREPLTAPLAIPFARALQAGGRTQRIGLRQVGDRALFIAGFFADSLAAGAMPLDYYVSLGGAAYQSLAREDLAGAPVFSELAEKFVPFVDVLSEVSEATSRQTAVDLLRLYDRWLQTGSRRTGQRLLDQGLVPGGPTAIQ